MFKCDFLGPIKVNKFQSMGTTNTLSLTDAPRGRTLEVVAVPAGRSREQLIRLGILAGETIRCIQRLPGGTMLVEKNRQEIAIGVKLASSIVVRLNGDAKERS